MRVVCYVRVSTEEQSAGGVSLEAQRARCLAYCGLHALEVLEVLEDAGESGKSLDRPGVRRALELLESGAAGGLVVAKLDRLSRSVVDFLGLVSRVFGDGGASLLSVSESIDTRSAGGRLVLSILVTLAQWERETIVERTRSALAHKRAKGERIGGVPYGFRLASDGRRLIADNGEQSAIVRGLELRAAGHSLAGIAATLEGEGYGPRNGGRWNRGSLARILRRRELELKGRV